MFITATAGKVLSGNVITTILDGIVHLRSVFADISSTGSIERKQRMPDQLITCPNCGTEFAVGDVLKESIRSQLRTELEADLVKKQAEATRRLNEVKEHEKELTARENAIEETVLERLEKERKFLQTAERRKVEKDLKATFDDLQEQLQEKNKKLDEANKKERDFLRLTREIQEKEESIDLEIERRLNAASKQLSENAQKKAHDALQLKLREKDDLIRGLQDRVGDLQRRMEQGSQESQGEALEGKLKDTLSTTFPFDSLEDIKKGTRGADIMQTVRDFQGRVCGRILWEAKNTKTFQNSWIDKLKQDQQEAGAAIAVIMTVALPSGIKQFGQIEEGGVWVTDYASTIGLCTALRQQLIRVFREKLMMEARETVKDILFEYVTGQEFNMRVRAVADTYIRMQQDLESEKRVLQRQWKKREKQIALVIDNIVGMRGELEGMIGTQASLPAIEALSLEYLVGDEESEDFLYDDPDQGKDDSINPNDCFASTEDDTDEFKDEAKATDPPSLDDSDDDKMEDEQDVPNPEKKAKALLPQQVSMLMLNQTVSNSLKKSRIRTIGDIVICSRDELKIRTGLSEEDLDYLQEKLEHNHLEFCK